MGIPPDPGGDPYMGDPKDHRENFLPDLFLYLLSSQIANVYLIRTGSLYMFLSLSKQDDAKGLWNYGQFVLDLVCAKFCTLSRFDKKNDYE